MEFDTSLSWVPDLKSAIERHPLTVLPTTPLNEAVALLCQPELQICSLAQDSQSSLSSMKSSARARWASCLLVVNYYRKRYRPVPKL